MKDESSAAKLTWRSPILRFKVLFTAMLLAFVCYGLFTWVLWPVKILGDSMLPNYHEGERHFINKFAYRSDPPRRGDVVGVRVANGDVYIKRIVALPGERFEYTTNFVVTINGEPLRESYTKTTVPWKVAPAALGPDEYYVMGDNRSVSVLGPIDRKLIIGKVVF